MKTRQTLVLLAIVFLLNVPAVAEDKRPAYLILRAPASIEGKHHHEQRYYPGKRYGVSTKTYAYGWFGAQPKKKGSRHFGYYRNFTQWSFR